MDTELQLQVGAVVFRNGTQSEVKMEEVNGFLWFRHDKAKNTPYSFDIFGPG
jgi:hypothetical protein